MNQVGAALNCPTRGGACAIIGPSALRRARPGLPATRSDFDRKEPVMNLGGYADKIARIDLGTGDVAYDHIDETDARKYVGARGLGVKYCFDNGPLVDPLGPDNLLCFMNGPLTGTEVTMSGRMAIVTKSPPTGTVP